MTLKHLNKRNVSNAGLNGNENHNPNNLNAHVNEKSASHSFESTTVGSSGAAKYLLNNNLHLRPVDT